MNSIRKVIVIGGGPAGILTALRLQQSHQIACVIYEVRQEPTTLGGAIGIPSNGLRLLQRLGLYEKLTEKGEDTRDMVIHSLKGAVMGKIDMVSWSRKTTGFGYMRIRRTDLMDVLLDAANAAKIPIHYGKHLASIEEKDDIVTTSFSDGTTESADFLLGCDGIHSSVRKLYVDPGCKPEYTGIANMYSLLSTSMLTPSAKSMTGLNMTLTSDGLFAITPVNQARDTLYWFFSREVTIPSEGDNRSGWEQRSKQEIDAVKTTLLQTLGDADSGWLEMLRDIVHKTEHVRFYPIYKIPAGRKWHKGRCLIIGDAAHAMPPHASQGVSMALEDAFLFSKLLDSQYNSIEDALQVYVEKRKARTEDMLKTTESNGSIRRKKGAWELWANERAISGGLWVYNMAGLDKLGLRQKPLAYDVEEEEFKL
ncbi:hypothetical protein C7974DRAFT_463192 [Boeremia exigua]|uniref:uncharacterized protein n=1 Tax=Boeremia exigua TaxID=749465 RepID=UPI001E8E23BE|nr:uncharacterized protein C7974DRAFT_463192 [Boeremia exigua]KAH6628958.1 hypothetical protein C7974DRAFT_463192 [Boeremia exigua]